MPQQRAIRKYPRTPHLTGSRLQAGDGDLSQVPIDALRGLPLVIEEKVDGANSAISFSPEGELLLQSRGHYLTGGPRERHFAQLKTWASTHSHAFWPVLGARYLVYGEWLYARHTIFYDALEHYFLEFDVYDRQEDTFLSTDRRHALLEGLPIHSVPVLHRGEIRSRKQLKALLGPSAYRTPQWRDVLREVAERLGQDPDRLLRETDASDLMEGLYIKVERDGAVVDRSKWVRSSFTDTIAAAGGHWHDRPILPNQLAPGVDIYRC
jgi:hypothetical protein